VNSWYHARSAAKKWGGDPSDYIAIEELIDSSKQFVGDVRHRALFHNTYGVWLCQRVFGRVVDLEKTSGGLIEVPVRLIAEQHILEDLGWLPTPGDYISGMPIKPWMSGAKMREQRLSTLGLSVAAEVSAADHLRSLVGDRSALIEHMHHDHDRYPAGHDFVLISTRDIELEHARLHRHDDVKIAEGDERA
jgi:hypothetical protein